MTHLLIPIEDIEKRLKSTETMAGSWASGIRDSLTQLLSQEQKVEIITDKDMNKHLSNWVGVNGYTLIKKIN